MTSSAEVAVQAPPVAAPDSWRRHRPYVLFMVFVAFFLNSLDRNIINVLLQPIKNEFHLKDWQLGMMTGLAFAMFYNVIGIATARFIDGGAVRRNIIAGGLALWSVATALCGMSQTSWQLLACRMGIGVGEGTFGPSTMTLISDYYGPNERARAMGLYLLGMPLALFVGLPLGGWGRAASRLARRLDAGRSTGLDRRSDLPADGQGTATRPVGRNGRESVCGAAHPPCLHDCHEKEDRRPFARRCLSGVVLDGRRNAVVPDLSSAQL